MKSVFKKTKEGIFPIDEGSMTLFDKIPNDSFVFVEFIKKRNYENHKRFFAMIATIYDMQEHFDNQDIFRKHILMTAGHFEEVVILNPKTDETTIQYWPKSINFETMGEVEFIDLFKKCITGFLRRYGNGMSEEDLMKVIEFD